MSKIIGYARGSGDGIQTQIQALEAHGCDSIYRDSGVEREQWFECSDALDHGDTLVITDINRIAKSFSELSSICRNLAIIGIELEICGEGDGPEDINLSQGIDEFDLELEKAYALG